MHRWFKGQLPSAATTRQGGLKLYIKRAEAPTLVLQSKNKQHFNARVLIETRSKAITVPSIAVQRGPKGLYVWEVRADSIARMRPIAIGPMTDDLRYSPRNSQPLRPVA
jgi:multidrug efflux pump subunit AcrA (membrane-fusion protein)